jgi:hypothetical protein
MQQQQQQQQQHARKACGKALPAMPSAPAGSRTQRVSLKHILIAAQISSVFTVIMPSTSALLICSKITGGKEGKAINCMRRRNYDIGTHPSYVFPVLQCRRTTPTQAIAQ